MRIGQLARRSGVSVRALRYYEEQRLLESARTSGGQRDYPDEALERVQLIIERDRIAARIQDLTRARTKLGRVIENVTAANVAQD